MSGNNVRLLNYLGLGGDPVAIIPSDNIVAFSAHQFTPSKTETDIYGNEVVIGSEVVSGDSGWQLEAAYLDKDSFDAVMQAYYNHSLLTLLDERGVGHTVTIRFQPTIERNRVVNGTIAWSVKLVLQDDQSANMIPKVVSLNGPTLFDRKPVFTNAQ